MRLRSRSVRCLAMIRRSDQRGEGERRCIRDRPRAGCASKSLGFGAANANARLAEQPLASRKCSPSTEPSSEFVRSAQATTALVRIDDDKYLRGGDVTPGATRRRRSPLSHLPILLFPFSGTLVREPTTHSASAPRRRSGKCHPVGVAWLAEPDVTRCQLEV